MLWAFAVVTLAAGCRSYNPVPSSSAIPRESDSAPPTAAPSQSRTNETDTGATAGSFDTLPPNVLAWDAKEKTYKAKADDDVASFEFNVTNVSAGAVVIDTTATSCGCTVAELPADPWILMPGDYGKLDVTMEIYGYTGTVEKEVMVFTSRGNVTLIVTAEIPEPELKPRAK